MARSRLKTEDGFEPFQRTIEDPRVLTRELGPGVFAFEALAPSLCVELLAEVEKHPREAPNTMNRYGTVLDDIGYGHLADYLLELTSGLARRAL